jgi:hypothetical protein
VTWFDQLNDGSAATALADWAASQPSLKSAWRACDRADWLFWIAARVARDERERKHVAVAGAYIVRRVRVRRLPPLIPTNGDIAVLWGSSVLRADSVELLNPLVSFAFAAPPALVMLVATAVTLRSVGNLAWSVALAMFAAVWIAVAAAIQWWRVRSVRRRLGSFDWATARSGVISALAKRVLTASAVQREQLASELRVALEEPGWLRLV